MVATRCSARGWHRDANIRRQGHDAVMRLEHSIDRTSYSNPQNRLSWQGITSAIQLRGLAHRSHAQPS